MDQLRRRWKEFTDRVAHYAPGAKGHLADVWPIEIGAEKAVFGVDPEFAASAQTLKITRNLKGVQKVLEEFFGRALAAEFVLRSRRDMPPPPPPPAASSSPANPASPAPPAGSPTDKRAWTENKAVREALELFNGDITDVRT